MTTTYTKHVLQPGMNHYEINGVIVDAECDQDAKVLWYKETKKDKVTYTEYDENGRVIYKKRTHNGFVSGKEKINQEWFGYDDHGNEIYYKQQNGDLLLDDTHRVFDEFDKVQEVVNKWGQRTTYTYDELGREIHQVMVNKEGKYVAQLFTEYDEHGNAKKYTSAPDSKIRKAGKSANNFIDSTVDFIGDAEKQFEEDFEKSTNKIPKIPWWGKLIIVLIVICNPILIVLFLGLFGAFIKMLPTIVGIVILIAVIKTAIKRLK